MNMISSGISCPISCAISRPISTISFQNSGLPIIGGGDLIEKFPNMSAAYSLRDLGNGGPVVRLYRGGSNPEERDFTAAEISGSVTGEELIAEPNFASSSGWQPIGGWSISGGKASLTSTVGSDFLSSDAVANHDYYLMTITIDSCSDFGEAGLRIASNNYRPFRDFGITTAGTYTFMVDRLWMDLSTTIVRFFSNTGIAGVSCVLSQCSLRPYTPTAAEQWALNPTSFLFPWRINGEYDANVQTWYDQSASNEQAIEDPNIQDVNAWSSSTDATEINVGSLVLEKVDTVSQVIRSAEVLPESAYKVEIDYTNTSTKSNAFRCYIGSSTGAILFPSGSGTISQIYTASRSAQFLVQSLNSANIGDELTITRISFIDIGNLATQDAITAQPNLIKAGVTQMENGKPAIVFDGSQDYLTLGTDQLGNTELFADSSDRFGIFSVEKGVVGTVFSKAVSSTGLRDIQLGYLSSTMFFNIRGVQTSTLDPIGVQRLRVFNWDGSSAVANINGGVDSVVGVGTAAKTTQDINIGGRSNGGFLLDGNIQEIIVYDSDQSENREIIETNINNYHEIYQ